MIHEGCPKVEQVLFWLLIYGRSLHKTGLLALEGAYVSNQDLADALLAKSVQNRLRKWLVHIVQMINIGETKRIVLQSHTFTQHVLSKPCFNAVSAKRPGKQLVLTSL